MRILIALTLIGTLQIASLTFAQSDAPPAPRFVRKHQLDVPPPSRKIWNVEIKSKDQPQKIEQIQFTEPVLAPPAEFPAPELKLLPEPASPKELKPLPLLAPTFPKNSPVDETLDQDETQTVESHAQPIIVQDQFKATPLERRTLLGKTGTWVPVEQEAPKPLDNSVIEKASPVITTVEKLSVEQAPTDQSPSNLPMAPPPPPEQPYDTAQTETLRPLSPAEQLPLGVYDEGWFPMTEEPFLEQQPSQFYTDPIYCDDCWYQGDSCQSVCNQVEYDQISPFLSLGVKGGNDRSLLDVQALLPLWQHDLDFVFVDLRGRFDDQEASQGEFGLGYRTFVSEDWIFGIYGYYDLLKTSERNRFNQFTTGIEFLSEDWDIRLNGYFPNEGGKPSNSANGISNGTIISNAFEERAATGFNAEIGKRIMHWGRYDSNELRWFVGYYHLDNSAPGFRKLNGPSTRLEYRCYDLSWLGEQSRLTAGVEYTSDDVRDSQYWGFVRVQVPFSPKWSRNKLDSLRRRFVDLPVRDID